MIFRSVSNAKLSNWKHPLFENTYKITGSKNPEKNSNHSDLLDQSKIQGLREQARRKIRKRNSSIQLQLTARPVLRTWGSNIGNLLQGKHEGMTEEFACIKTNVTHAVKSLITGNVKRRSNWLKIWGRI